MKTFWGRVGEHFLPLVFVLTFASALIFVTYQQNLRSSFNDPLLDQASVIADSLKTQSPKGAQANNVLDLTKSNSLFVIVLDESNKPLYSTAQIDGNTPTLPDGVINTAKDKGENKITWEPKKGVRLATVVLPYTSVDEKGVVVVGKSLAPVDQKTKDAMTLIGFSTVFASLVLLAVIALLKYDFASKVIRPNTALVPTKSVLTKEVAPKPVVVQKKKSK